MLEVWRQGQQVDLKLTPVQSEDGSYKLGIWVRDNIQGIGTLTYVEEDGSFGALGHGISDVDAGGDPPGGSGRAVPGGYPLCSERAGWGSGRTEGRDSLLSGGKKSARSRPIPEWESTETLSSRGMSSLPLRQVEIARRQEVREGPATLLCAAGGSPEEYEIQITAIHWDQQDTNKCFTIQVTDPRLLKRQAALSRE